MAHSVNLQCTERIYFVGTGALRQVVNLHAYSCASDVAIKFTNLACNWNSLEPVRVFDDFPLHFTLKCT